MSARRMGFRYSRLIQFSCPRPQAIVLERTASGRRQVAGAGENGPTIFIPRYPSVQQPNPAARPKLEEEQNDSLKGIAARGPRLGWMENRRARRGRTTERTPQGE